VTVFQANSHSQTISSDVNMNFFVDEQGILHLDKTLKPCTPNVKFQSEKEESIENCSKVMNVNEKNNETETFSQKDSELSCPLKQFLFWPKETTFPKKKRDKIRMPSVLSSEEGLKWYKNIEERKQKIEEEKKLRKTIRIEKALIKKEKIEQAKQLKKN